MAGADFTIGRRKMYTEPCYVYFVEFEDPNRPIGRASTSFGSFGAPGGYLLPEYKPLGLNRGDLVAEILEFYPTSGCQQREYPEYERHGVGSALLERIIKDSQDQGAKVLLASSVRPKMVRFLAKHGFSKRRETDQYYYLLLQNINLEVVN